MVFLKIFLIMFILFSLWRLWVTAKEHLTKYMDDGEY